MNRFLILVMILATGTSIAGEPSKVRFPKGDVEWIADITFSSASLPIPQPGSELSAYPTRIHFTSSQGIRRYKIAWSNQKQSEVWEYKGSTLLQDPVTGLISHDSGSLVPGLIIKLDASIFDWLSSSKSAEVSKYQEKPCVLYEIDPLPGELGPGNVSDDFYARRAWIDAETKLPLAYDNTIAIYRFTFLTETPEPLVLPAKFAQAYQVVRNSITQPPAWARSAKAPN